MAPWHLVLNDDCCLKLFELCDGKSLAHIARTDKRLHARVSDRNSTAASPGAQVWRQLCASHDPSLKCSMSSSSAPVVLSETSKCTVSLQSPWKVVA